MPAGMRGREGNMKKKLLGLMACVATLALSGALLAGCSGSGDKTGGDSADGKETLTVGFDQSYPPYGFVGDDGKFTGFDLDLAQAVCDKNGWELKLSAIDWDAKDALLAQGNINCIWNGFTMEGREDGYTFSDPYMLNEQVIVVKSDSGIADSAALSERGAAFLRRKAGCLNTFLRRSSRNERQKDPCSCIGSPDAALARRLRTER